MPDRSKRGARPSSAACVRGAGITERTRRRDRAGAPAHRTQHAAAGRAHARGVHRGSAQRDERRPCRAVAARIMRSRRPSARRSSATSSCRIGATGSPLPRSHNSRRSRAGVITHGDIVVEVQARFVVAIGGNVGDSARKRRYPQRRGSAARDRSAADLHARRRRGRAARPAVADELPLAGRSTARIFALSAWSNSVRPFPANGTAEASSRKGACRCHHVVQQSRRNDAVRCLSPAERRAGDLFFADLWEDP